MVGSIKKLSELVERYPIIFKYIDCFGGSHYIAQAYKRVLLFSGRDEQINYVEEFFYSGFAILSILKAEESLRRRILQQRPALEIHARLSSDTFSEIASSLNLDPAVIKASPSYADLVKSSSVVCKDMPMCISEQDAIDALMEKLVFHLGMIQTKINIDVVLEGKSYCTEVKMADWYAEYPLRKHCPECRSKDLVYDLNILKMYIKCNNCHYEANAHSRVNEGMVASCTKDLATFQLISATLQEKMASVTSDVFRGGTS